MSPRKQAGSTTASTTASATTSTTATALPVMKLKSSRRIVASIMGQEGHGKTHMALTWPQPIRLLSMDPNTESIVEQVFKVNDVADLDPEVCQYSRAQFPVVGLGVSEKIVQAEAQDAWFMVEDAIREIYEDRLEVPVRSVVIDSGTLLERLNTLREFGRTDQIAPSERMRKFGILNKDFTGLFDLLERAGVHVAVTHRAKPRWEDYTKSNGEEGSRVVPGVFDRLGFKEFGNLSNTELLMLFDQEKGGRLRDKFGVRVLRARQRPALIGREFWGRDEETGQLTTSFACLAMHLYPGTTVEDWV